MLMVQLHGLTCDMFDLSPFRLQVRLQNSCAEEAVRLLGAIHRGFGCPQLMVCLEAGTGAQTFVVDVFLEACLSTDDKWLRAATPESWGIAVSPDWCDSSDVPVPCTHCLLISPVKLM